VASKEDFDLAKENGRLRREIKLLKEEGDILKNGSRPLPQPSGDAAHFLFCFFHFFASLRTSRRSLSASRVCGSNDPPAHSISSPCS